MVVRLLARLNVRCADAGSQDLVSRDPGLSLLALRYVNSRHRAAQQGRVSSAPWSDGGSQAWATRVRHGRSGQPVRWRS